MGDLAPYSPYVIMAIDGLVAGWLVGLLLGGGLIRNLFVGIIGAFVGGLLVNAGRLNLPDKIKATADVLPCGEQILVSTIGAIFVVILARVVAR